MNDLIQVGQQALDEIEADEAFDPRFEVCQNFCTDSGQRRVEARRSLNFPGIHGEDSPENSHAHEEQGPSGLNQLPESRRADPKPSESESLSIKNKHVGDNSNNNNSKETKSPELEPGYMYDIDIYHPNGHVITFGAPYVSPTGRSSPSSTKSSPPALKKKNQDKIPKSPSGAIGKRKRTRSSSLKKPINPAKRHSRKWSDRELLDFSFRSDNATGNL